MLADESLEVTGSPGLGTEAGRPGPGCVWCPPNIAALRKQRASGIKTKLLTFNSPTLPISLTQNTMKRLIMN